MKVINVQLQNSELLEAFITLAHSRVVHTVFLQVQVSVFSSSWYIFSFIVLQAIRYNKPNGCKSGGLF